MDTSYDPHAHPLLLMEGGPLYRIERRLGLAKSNSPRIIRRAFLLVAITWVPMLILCLLQGIAAGNNVAVPFLKDYSAYTRFLLALPLFLAAETILGPRIAEAAAHFVRSGLVGPKDYGNFDDAVKHGLQMRDSIFAEIIILFLSYTITLGAARGIPLKASTWHVVQTSAGPVASWANWWLAIFCAPLLQFFFLRWLWRLFLWFRFLRSMRSLDLDLVPTHPDRAAGLGFVGMTQKFFGILLFIYSIGVAGVLANQVVYDRVPLQHFAIPIAVYVCFGVIVAVGPLALFAGMLVKAKRIGLLQYGTLASAYTSSFHNKWIRGINESGDRLLGTEDIQSLADLGNSYEFIQRMNTLLVTPRTILQLAVTTVLPMVPLLLTVMSPKEIVQLLLKVLM
jgi:hypothetical protein